MQCKPGAQRTHPKINTYHRGFNDSTIANSIYRLDVDERVSSLVAAEVASQKSGEQEHHALGCKYASVAKKIEEEASPKRTDQN